MLLLVVMTGLTLYTDTELLHVLRQHNMLAFEEIYNRYWSKLFDAAYHRMKQKETCEEMIQEVFATLWEKRETLEITTSLSGYLFSAVKYKVIDFYRKQLVRASHATTLAAAATFDNSAEEQIFLHDLMVHIEKVVLQLPVKCRNVYELSRIKHKSNKEIATLLNISEKTVEGHLTKALQVLRLSYGDFGGTRDTYVFRLGETYLVAAEAFLKAGNTSKALEYFNAIRTRAAKPGTNPVTGVTYALEMQAATLNIDNILDERARELSGEEMRWFELKRTGTLITRTLAHNEEARAANTLVTKHLLRPVPQSQIDLNRGAPFPQNTGY